MWTRRGLAASGFLGALALARTPARANAPAQQPHAVYHLHDLDRVGLVLGCIRNHYAGTAGDPVMIALVIHGSALRAFRKPASPDVADPIADFVENGLMPWACANTLRAEGFGLGDLLPGFRVAEKGGVVKLAELQAQGFAYIRL